MRDAGRERPASLFPLPSSLFPLSLEELPKEIIDCSHANNFNPACRALGNAALRHVRDSHPHLRTLAEATLRLRYRPDLSAKPNLSQKNRGVCNRLVVHTRSEPARYCQVASWLLHSHSTNDIEKNIQLREG